MLKYMKVEEMKNGYLYKIHARNASYGIWVSRHDGFLIRRTKFKETYTFVELHWDVSSDFGTARPIMELEKAPFTEEELIEYGGPELLTWLDARTRYWETTV